MMVDVGACRLHVRDDGDGYPLLFAHSLSFDSNMWRAQSDALRARHRVLRVDLRGHGATDWDRDEHGGDLQLDDLADDLARALDTLGIARVGYVGLSLGGMVGMRFALRHPERLAALALLNTSAEPEPDSVRDGYHQANESSRGDKGNPMMASFMLGLMFSDGFRASQPDAVEPYRNTLLEQPDPQGLYHVAKAVIWRPDILQQLSAIATPTLVIASKGDRAISVDRGRALAKAIPGARFLELGDDCGHMSAVEQPGAVNEALAELFEELK